MEGGLIFMEGRADISGAEGLIFLEGVFMSVEGRTEICGGEG